MTSTFPVQIIPMGGLGEIGKNSTIFSYGDTMLLVDAGLMFPTDEMHGVDYVVPDYTYLLSQADRLKAILLTHGHEDHIGGLVYLLRRLPHLPPIYGTRLTLGLVEDKLSEAGLLEKCQLIEVTLREPVAIGPFEAVFIHVCHSIPDSAAIALHTPVGTIIHSGDFKMDPTPVDGHVTDYYKFAEYGEKGVLLLMSDSTNVEKPGLTPSERDVGPVLDELVRDAIGRVIVASFASNIHRIQQIINAAERHGRKVAIVGRSMERVTQKAIALGFLHVPSDLIVRISDIRQHNDHEVLVLTTGSQGEPMSGLSRISTGEFRSLKIQPGDTVIISAVPIPGNERSVSKVTNLLFGQGAEVIYEHKAGMHVSGHASQEDLRLMLNLTKPRFFMPIHGEYKHLIRHAELAEYLVPHDRIMVGENGSILELRPDLVKFAGFVPSGMVMIDAAGRSHVATEILAERQKLAEDGVVSVAISIGQDKGLKSPISLAMKGVITIGDEEIALRDLIQKIEAALEVARQNPDRTYDLDRIRNVTTEVLNRYFQDTVRCRPQLIVQVQMVG